MPEARYLHICEVCGREEILTSDEGYEAGWDYPPRMGVFGELAPRKCGPCGIEDTLWWRLVVEKQTDLNGADRVLVARIRDEPESILVHGED